MFRSLVDIENHLKDVHNIAMPASDRNVANSSKVSSPRRVRIIHKCVLCLKTFHSRVLIERHLKEVHDGQPLINLPTTTSIVETIPVMIKSPAKSIVRKISNARNRRVRSEYTCALCSKKFTAKAKIETHLKLSHSDTITVSNRLDDFDDKFFYICDNCGSKFDKKSKLNRHMKTHTRPSIANTSACDICGKMFANSYRMQRHRNVHYENPSEDDDLWGSPATSKKIAPDDQLADSLVVMIDNKKFYQCDKCPYKRDSRIRILEHRRTHTGERPYFCEKCGKQFNNPTLLRNHLLSIHEGVRNFSCDICHKVFVTKHYVDEHRRIHTGEKPFVCDLCGSAFTHLTSLLTHKHRHSDSPKFKCPWCPETFKYNSTLNLHKKRHTGELKHKCQECGKCFIDKQHLTRHLTVHSDARPFICDICGATFKLKKYLSAHKKTHKNAMNAKLNEGV